MEHPSLNRAKTTNFTTKPLVDAKEIEAIAKKALLKEVEAEIERLTHQDDTQKEILYILKEIREVVTKTSEENAKTAATKLLVLNRIKYLLGM